MTHLYDTIGIGYRALRRPDPRIAAAIAEALGPAASVVNVGAGAGSYEPADRPVVAVELSREMIRQRPAGAAPVVQATATALPFRPAPSTRRWPCSPCTTGPIAPRAWRSCAAWPASAW